MAVIFNKAIKSIVITISFVGLLGFLFCLPISSKAEEKNVVSEEFLNYLNDSVFVSDPMNTNHLSEVRKSHWSWDITEIVDRYILEIDQTEFIASIKTDSRFGYNESNKGGSLTIRFRNEVGFFKESKSFFKPYYELTFFLSEYGDQNNVSVVQAFLYLKSQQGGL